METSWTDCILFTSRSEEKSPRLFLDCSGSGSVGVRRRNRLAPEPSLPLSLLPSLPPTAAAKAPSPFQPGLRLGPIILSGLSFGISISKCPQFLVTQTLVAVCFSTDHPGKLRIRPLRADPRLVFHPRCPISIGSDHSASIELGWPTVPVFPACKFLAVEFSVLEQEEGATQGLVSLKAGVTEADGWLRFSDLASEASARGHWVRSSRADLGRGPHVSFEEFIAAKDEERGLAFAGCGAVWEPPPSTLF
ncbi:hypothetical protein CB1_001251021 [Camelus ferus]|nr:hypothetical protein CB1_001251021 [Camelus ferus]